MGRYAGWIALHAGMAGGAHAILIPEIPFDLDAVAARHPARATALAGAHSIVVVAEGAQPAGGAARAGGAGGRRPRGAAGRHRRARRGAAGRAHRQGMPRRGARPPAARRQPVRLRPRSRLRFGAAAVRALAAGDAGVMVALGEAGDQPGAARGSGRPQQARRRGWRYRADSRAKLGICLGDIAAGAIIAMRLAALRGISRHDIFAGLPARRLQLMNDVLLWLRGFVPSLCSRRGANVRSPASAPAPASCSPSGSAGRPSAKRIPGSSPRWAPPRCCCSRYRPARWPSPGLSSAATWSPR